MNKAKYCFLALLAFGLVLSTTLEVEARRGGSSFSSSRSSSPSRSSSSWGSSSRSKPSSAKSSSSGKSSGSSWGSSSKAKPVSAKSARAAKMSSTKKTQYQNRSKAAKATVAKTTPTDWKNNKSKYSSNSTYKPRSNVSYGKKYSPAERNIYRQRYNNTYNGYYYNDPYDHGMIWGFSSLWWYHHWDTVDRSHYANDARMREIEREMATMKAQGLARNAGYKDPNMDESVMYSQGYMEGVKSGSLKEEPMQNQYKNNSSRIFVPDQHKNNNSRVGWWILGAVIVLTIVIGFSVYTDKRY